MQKRYALLHKVLRHFRKVGILDDLVLVGSWCLYFYQDYFSPGTFFPSIRTRDIDFAVIRSRRKGKKVDVAELLKNEGFITTFSRSGYVRLEHPDILIEFLVPERGKGTDMPYPLPSLGVNAQALRFLDFLLRNIISIRKGDIQIQVPHPAAFALHKLIVSSRRKSEEKKLKEIAEATEVAKALAAAGESKVAVEMFYHLPDSWKRIVMRQIKKYGIEEMKTLIQEGQRER